MSNPTEPLKLTLEEAMHEHRRRRQAEPHLGDVWMDHDGKWRRKAIAGPGTIHDNWPEAFSESWGVRVVARDEAAEDCFCDKCGWTGKATYPDYRHEGCGYGALPIWRMKLYAAKKEAAELREENKRLRALVDELLLAPNPLDDENMRLRAVLTELVDRVGYRSVEWAGVTTCSYCGADEPDFAHSEGCAIQKAEAALAASEGES